MSNNIAFGVMIFCLALGSYSFHTRRFGHGIYFLGLFLILALILIAK